MHGNAFLAHVYNAGGGLIGLWPIHPCGVEVIYDENAIGRRLYKVSQIDGTHKIFSVLDMTHIPGLCVDGLRGLSLISMARNGLGIAIAADKASARMFSSGALLNGLVTSEEDLTGDEAKEIQASITNNMSGADNAGAIRVINRKLKYTAMSMTAADAQWLESRQFEIEEIARYTGVPPHLLMQTSKQTSWGTGVAEQNRGLARYTLMPFTTRIEQRLSRLRPRPQFAEFDFAGLVAPTPEEEITLLIAQVAGGLITVNEARHIRNMDPIEGGDVLNVPNGMGAAALLKPPTPVPSEVPA
jgi:HK97 family phage portal protein